MRSDCKRFEFRNASGKNRNPLNRKSEIEIRKCGGPDWARTSDPALIKRML